MASAVAETKLGGGKSPLIGSWSSGARRLGRRTSGSITPLDSQKCSGELSTSTAPGNWGLTCAKDDIQFPLDFEGQGDPQLTLRSPGVKGRTGSRCSPCSQRARARTCVCVCVGERERERESQSQSSKPQSGRKAPHSRAQSLFLTQSFS